MDSTAMGFVPDDGVATPVTENDTLGDHSAIPRLVAFIEDERRNSAFRGLSKLPIPPAPRWWRISPRQ